MAYNILTVSREFGSGGHSIAEKVAKRLEIPFYDREIVDKIAVETGFSPEFIAEESEYAKSRSIFAYAFAFKGAPGIMGGLSPWDYLWTVQKKVILEVAEKGPCVIIGRCADHILKDRNDVLHVFIHADKEYRAERVITHYGETDTPALKRLEEKDGKRGYHYRHFTDKVWGMSQNYHLSLDSHVMGEERCVDLIVDLMRG